MAKIEKKQRYGIWYSHKTENYLKLIVCHAGRDSLSLNKL